MTPGLHPLEIEELAHLIGLMEDWLLHAEPETLDDLASFLPNPPCNQPGRVIDALGNATIRLRRLHLDLTS